MTDVLQNLPGSYSFEVSTSVDERQNKVRQKIERAAERATEADALFLLYYFGHGALLEDYGLAFVHPGRRKGDRELLSFSAVEGVVRDVARARKALFLVDCCFAGAAARSIELSMRGQFCILASTTPTARAYLHYDSLEPPIGAFTRVILEGLLRDEACVSQADNRITADSLFRYAEERTRKLTSDVQVPYVHGRLGEVLSEYRRVPAIRPGVSRGVNEKTSYCKILAICRTLKGRDGWRSASQLHSALLRHYRSSFLTPYREPGGGITYRPVKVGVVAKYVHFLRVIGFVDVRSLRLSRHGRAALRYREREFNERVLEGIETYLSRRGLSREIIDDTLRSVLGRRRVPTLMEVKTDLTLIGHGIRAFELRLVLDLLGHIGALRTSGDRVYFPW
jgi:hypothetical protein